MISIGCLRSERETKIDEDVGGPSWISETESCRSQVVSLASEVHNVIAAKDFSVGSMSKSREQQERQWYMESSE